MPAAWHDTCQITAVSASSHPPVEIGHWQQGGALLLVAVLAGLQLRAMLGPFEDWPFTSAPMFARYHTAEDPLFELLLTARLADGREVEIVPMRDLGVGELAFRRQFFAKHYGSADPKHPGGHFGQDTKAAFERRLREKLQRIARVYERTRGTRVAGVHLEVRRVTTSAAESRRVLQLDLAYEPPSR